MPYLRSMLHAAVSACALAACGSGGTGPSGPTGSIAGTVLNVSTDQPLEGATVSAGSIQTTTDANGRYDLAGVPVGPAVTMRSQRLGFVAYTEDIAVQQGSNTHDIPMTRQSLFELPGVAVYVPPDVSTVRGVILQLGGEDTRGLATAVCGAADPAICAVQQQLRLHYLALAATHGLAIMGSGALSRDQTLTDDVLIGALNSIAISSDRPELAQAPLLIFGISSGAPQSYGFTLRRSDRVIGFMVITGSTPSTVRSGAAQRVPGYVLLAEFDTEVNNGKLTEFFVDNRAEGALWTFAVEPGAIHQPPSLAAQSLLVEWMDTILQLRLPPTVTPGAPLESITEASGWLGNRTSFAIAAYSAYVGNKLDASWFPSQETAQSWEGFVTP